MPFQPGQSGNPGGRPKKDPELQAMFQAKGIDAFNVIAELINHPDPKIRLPAAQTLLDRAFGKPSQTSVIEGNPEAPVCTYNEIALVGHSEVNETDDSNT